MQAKMRSFAGLCGSNIVSLPDAVQSSSMTSRRSQAMRSTSGPGRHLGKVRAVFRVAPAIRTSRLKAAACAAGEGCATSSSLTTRLRSGMLAKAERMRDEASSPSSQPISLDDVTTSFEGPNIRVTWGGTVDYDQRDEAPSLVFAKPVLVTEPRHCRLRVPLVQRLRKPWWLGPRWALCAAGLLRACIPQVCFSAMVCTSAMWIAFRLRRPRSGCSSQRDSCVHCPVSSGQRPAARERHLEPSDGLT